MKISTLKSLMLVALTILSLGTLQAQTEPTVLLEEHFDAITDGSIANPGTTDLGGFSGFLYKTLKWDFSSTKCYAAGGSVLVEDGGKIVTSRISAYSSDGMLRITFRLKAKAAFGTLMGVQLGYSSSNLKSFLFSDDEWHTVTAYMSASSGNISFISTVSGFFIDDVKVEQSKSFVAPPTAKQPMDADGTQFTAKWTFASGTASKFLVNVYSKDEQGQRQYVKERQEVKPLSAYSTDASLKVTDLNPEVTYYYNVIAVNSTGNESDESNEVTVVRIISELAAPVALEATNVTPTGFTANWEAVTDAERYNVLLFKTFVATETTDVEALAEDFSKINKGKPESVEYGPLSGDLNEYTETPGWYSKNPAFAAGMLVLSPYSTPALLETPVMDLSAAGGSVTAKYTMQAGAYGTYYDTESVTVYLLDYSKDVDKADTLAAEVIAINDKAMKEYSVAFTGATEASSIMISYVGSRKVFIDEVKIDKKVNAGDEVTKYVAEMPAEGTSLQIDVTPAANEFYSYMVVATATTVDADGDQITVLSSASNTIKVDQSDVTAIETVSEANAASQCLYDLNGRSLNTLRQGLNIVNGRVMMCR